MARSSSIPGLITEAQRTLFWRLWAGACRAQNWTREAGLSAAEINARRHEMLRECGFDSLNSVDRKDGFDRVKRKLELLAEQLKAAVETVQNEGGRMTGHERRLRWVLATELLPQVAAMIGNPQAYCAAILQDKFGPDHTVIAELTDEPVLTPRPTRTGETRIVEHESRLQQLVNTLNVRVRDEAKHACMDMDAVRALATRKYWERLPYFHDLAGSPEPARPPKQEVKNTGFDPYPAEANRRGPLASAVCGD